MTHPISSVPARAAIVLAVSTIVLTAIVGAGGVAAESASTATEVESTPDRAVPVHASTTIESPDAESGLAAETGDGAAITLTVVEETDDSITVSIATTAADTMAYAAGLTYDDDVVTIESIDGADFDAPVTNRGDGALEMTQSRLPQAAVDDPELATITFAAAEAGETSVSFDAAATIVETPDGEVTPLETQGLTISVGDESGGSPIGGAPGGSDDGTGVATNESAGTDTDGDDSDGSTDETPVDGEEAGTDPAAEATDEPASEDDEDASPVPGFTATAALVAVLTGLTGRVARRTRRR